MELNPQRDPLLSEEPKPAYVFGAGRPLGSKKEVSDREVSTSRLSGRPDAEGNEVRVWEQPWHTNAAYMLASGKYNAKQVCRALDKSYASILDLLRNAWFQEKIALIQKENGAGDIMDLFRSECHSSLVTLIEIRDDTKAPASVRRASAIDILHQVLGKPTQKVETVASIASDDPVAEAERLEQQNALLRKNAEDAARSGPN